MSLKPKLEAIIEEFFGLGGNHDLTKHKEYRDKVFNLIKDEELCLDTEDKNFILATDFIRFIDADRAYARTTNSREAYHYAKPFLERFMESDLNKWDYYDLKLLIASIHFTENIDQSVALASKIDKRTHQFKRVRLTEMLQATLAVNMSARVLNAKYFDDDVQIDLVAQFDSLLIRLECLVNEKKNKILELFLLVAKIRWNIFNRDVSQVVSLCNNLNERFGEEIGQMIQSESDFYMGTNVFESDQIRERDGEGLTD